MQIFLLIFPGILLLFSAHFNKKPLSELLVYIVGVSLSFFVLFPWLLMVLHFPMAIAIYIVFVGTLFLLYFWRDKLDLQGIRADRGEMMIVWALLLVVLLRCLPMFFQLTPAGVNMSAHSYAARLMIDNDGIQAYGDSGFSNLSASISMLGNIPAHRSSLLLSCLSYAFISFGLYIILLKFLDRNLSAAFSIAATFLTRSPQNTVAWGGAPIMLSLFFLAVALSVLIGPKKELSLLKFALALLAILAALMTYPVVSILSGAIFWSSLDVKTLLLELIAAVPFIIFVFAALMTGKIIEGWNRKLVFGLIAIGIVYYSGFYLYNSISMCPVTRSDMEAFDWMDSILNKSMIVENNYGDAGLWIPAMTGMTITSPYEQVANADLPKLKPAYIYIGSKAVGPIDIKVLDLEYSHRKYRRIYSNGEAQVWKILR